MLFLNCIVLVHFTMIWAPGGPKMTSARVSCWSLLKLAIEWGTRLEILKNEKNDRRYAALKTKPKCVESQHLTMDCRVGISMIDFILALKGLLRAKALR